MANFFTITIYCVHCFSSMFNMFITQQVQRSNADCFSEQHHIVLLYSGRNAHIFVRSRLKSIGKSVTCIQVSRSVDTDLVD